MDTAALVAFFIFSLWFFCYAAFLLPNRKEEARTLLALALLCGITWRLIELKQIVKGERPAVQNEKTK